MNTIFELEIAQYIKNGWVLVNKTDEFAQLSKERSKSCLLVLILLVFGILPGILYLLIPSGKDIKTLWAKDSAAHQAELVARQQAEVDRLAVLAERRVWRKAHPAEARAAFLKGLKQKLTIAAFIVLGVLIATGGFYILLRIAGIH